MDDDKIWYLYIKTSTQGPYSLEEVTTLIENGSAQLLDFAWSNELTKWHRLSDLDEFQNLVPQYPKSPIPSRDKKPIKKKPNSPKVESIKVEKETRKEIHKEIRKEAEPPKKEEWKKNRRYIRIPASAQATIEGHGTYQVGDLSEGGLFLLSNSQIPLGLEVRLVLQIGNENSPLNMTGVVIRHGISYANSAPGFAIEFTRLNPAHKRFLKEYIEHNL